MKKRQITQFLSLEDIKKIAREYGRTKGATDLSNELGVSKQRIQQIAVRLRKEGIKIPKMRVGKYQQISQELKEENPELFNKGRITNQPTKQ